MQKHAPEHPHEVYRRAKQAQSVLQVPQVTINFPGRTEGTQV